MDKAFLGHRGNGSFVVNIHNQLLLGMICEKSI
jgi:hypothetical protein